MVWLYLVGGFDHLEKMMEFVNGFRMTSPAYEMENNMFQTTNQWLLNIINHY